MIHRAASENGTKVFSNHTNVFTGICERKVQASDGTNFLFYFDNLNTF